MDLNPGGAILSKDQQRTVTSHEKICTKTSFQPVSIPNITDTVFQPIAEATNNLYLEEFDS